MKLPALVYVIKGILLADDGNVPVCQLRWLKGWSHLLRNSQGMRAGRKPSVPCGCWAVLYSQFCSGTWPCWVCKLSGSVPGRWKEAETHPRKQVGVVHSWETALEVLCKMMERKRSASLEKSLLSKKSLQEVTTTRADSFLSKATDPAAPCKLLPDKMMHFLAPIFWAMLLSQYVLVNGARQSYHPLGIITMISPWKGLVMSLDDHSSYNRTAAQARLP